MKIDRWDLVILFGAAVVAVGFWFLWPPAVAFWMGFVIMMLGIAGARK